MMKDPIDPINEMSGIINAVNTIQDPGKKKDIENHSIKAQHVLNTKKVIRKKNKKGTSKNKGTIDEVL